MTEVVQVKQWHSVTVRVEFDSAHRVMGHGGKCRHLHGHRYVVEVTLTAPKLDKLGMVVDFGDVKPLFKNWIDMFWDHNTILHYQDELLLQITNVANGGRAPYAMDNNPTAENMAEFLYSKFAQMVKKPVTILNVRVQETPGCYADYSRTESPVDLR